MTSVELVWDTPLDEDQGDHARAQIWTFTFCNPTAHDWFDEGGLDCYSLNPSTRWGDLDELDDDAVLSTDDSNGAGPEVISLRACGIVVGSGWGLYRGCPCM